MTEAEAQETIRDLRVELALCKLLATDYGELANDLCRETDDCEVCKYKPLIIGNYPCRIDCLNAMARKIGITGVFDE